MGDDELDRRRRGYVSVSGRRTRNNCATGFPACWFRTVTTKVYAELGTGESRSDRSTMILVETIPARQSSMIVPTRYPLVGANRIRFRVSTIYGLREETPKEKS
jgi:hypothetical protein